MRGVRISTSSFLRKPLSRRPLEYSSRIDSSFVSSSRKNLNQKNIPTLILIEAADITYKMIKYSRSTSGSRFGMQTQLNADPTGSGSISLQKNFQKKNKKKTHKKDDKDETSPTGNRKNAHT